MSRKATSRNLVYRKIKIAGAALRDLLSEPIENAIGALPIPV